MTYFALSIVVIFYLSLTTVTLTTKRKLNKRKGEEFEFGKTDYDSSNEEAEWEDEETMGVLIHFTPVAIFVYRSKDGIITSDNAGVYRLIDSEGKEREVSGTVLSFEVNSQQELESKLQAYHITSSSLPIVQLDAEEN